MVKFIVVVVSPGFFWRHDYHNNLNIGDFCVVYAIFIYEAQIYGPHVSTASMYGPATSYLYGQIQAICILGMYMGYITCIGYINYIGCTVYIEYIAYIEYIEYIGYMRHIR